MGRFECDDSYKDDLKFYAGSILLGCGSYSPTAEREIICLTDEGNTVAAKMYGDLIYFSDIPRKDRYKEAFNLYLKAAGITIDDKGDWKFDGRSYPLALYNVGFFLVNYRVRSVLRDCEPIDVIDKMTMSERYVTALELALSCLEHVDAADAINLVGRIMHEASVNEEMYNALKPVIDEQLKGRELELIPITVGNCDDMAECGDIARRFFEASAAEGYVYACNNLAAVEARRIVEMYEDGADKDELDKAVSKYVGYLKLSADKYEPYAANRLGMFYTTGEVSSEGSKAVFHDLIDKVMGKEYLKKATVYLDMNSAWAFYNLMKYYPKDYDNNLELTNDYMDYIKQLNPDVYDLAMEL